MLPAILNECTRLCLVSITVTNSRNFEPAVVDDGDILDDFIHRSVQSRVVKKLRFVAVFYVQSHHLFIFSFLKPIATWKFIQIKKKDSSYIWNNSTLMILFELICLCNFMFFIIFVAF